MDPAARLRQSLAKNPQLAKLYRKVRRLPEPKSKEELDRERRRAKRKQTRRFDMVLPATNGAEPTRLVHWSVPNHLTVPKSLQLKGLAGYEPETLACYLGLMDVAAPGPVWDVGANVGVYALMAAGLSDREVLAFEPTPLTAGVARRMLESNGLHADVFDWALGDHEGHATLYLSTSSDSSNSTKAGFREASGTVKVPVRTIDHVIAEGRTPPAILKIDTETTEPPILRGAAKLIDQHRPWILCEALPGRTETELMEVMRPHGYTWHLIGSEVPYPARDPIQGHVSLYMWLFAPTEIPDQLWPAITTWRERLAACTPTAAAEAKTAVGRSTTGAE